MDATSPPSGPTADPPQGGGERVDGGQAPRANPAWAALTAGLALALVALGWAAALAPQAGLCPDLGPSLTCAAASRPRLASLGPAPIAALAVLGATLTACLSALCLLPAPGGGPRPRALLAGASLVAALAGGFALGLQPLGWLGAASACPLCLALAVAAAAHALALGALLRRRDGLAPRPARLALALALLATAGPAAWAGRRVAADDEAAHAAVLAAGSGRADAPVVLLVTRPGCPWCRALVGDVLGHPDVLAALGEAARVEEVPRADPRAGRLPGVPAVVVLGPGGARRGALVGYRPDVGRFLAELRPLLAGSGGAAD